MSGAVHPFGVRIPPDPGDANHEPAPIAGHCVDIDGTPWHEPGTCLCRSGKRCCASRTPQAPRTAPDSTPRESADQDAQNGTQDALGPVGRAHLQHLAASPNALLAEVAQEVLNENPPPRGSADRADGSEALTARLTNLIYDLHMAGTEDHVTLARALTPHWLAYGREQAEHAPLPHEVLTYLAAEAAGGDEIADRMYREYRMRPPLTACADELGRAT